MTFSICSGLEPSGASRPGVVKSCSTSGGSVLPVVDVFPFDDAV